MESPPTRRGPPFALVLLIAGGGAMLFGLANQNYAPDEAMWIVQGQKAWALVRDRDWESREWSNADATWGYMNPPVAKYVIGFALEAQHVEWTWRGQPPPPPVLVAARRASILFGILGLLGLLWIASATISQPGSRIAAALFLASPLWLTVSRRAMTDVHGVSLALLAFGAFLAASKEWDGLHRVRRVAAWLALSAVLAGLAVGAKLNAASMPAALGLLLLLALVRELRRPRGGKRRAAPIVIVLGALFAASSVAVFVLSNPYLHPSPWERFAGILSWWQTYGEGQIQRSAAGRFGHAFDPVDGGLRVLAAKIAFPPRAVALWLLAPVVAALLARFSRGSQSPRMARLVGWLLLVPATMLVGGGGNQIVHAWIVWLGLLGGAVAALVSMRGLRGVTTGAVAVAAWAAVVTFFVWRMTNLPTARYYLPLVPIVCVLAGQAFASLRDDVSASAGKWPRTLVDAALVLAVLSTLACATDYSRSDVEGILGGKAPALARGFHVLAVAALCAGLVGALVKEGLRPPNRATVSQE